MRICPPASRAPGLTILPTFNLGCGIAAKPPARYPPHSFHGMMRKVFEQMGVGVEDVATAIVLFGHGSRVEDANEGVRTLARQIEAAGPYRHVRAAFLELGLPDLAGAVTEAVNAGFQRVIVIPFF